MHEKDLRKAGLIALICSVISGAISFFLFWIFLIPLSISILALLWINRQLGRQNVLSKRKQLFEESKVSRRTNVLFALVLLAIFLDSFTAFLWSKSNPAIFLEWEGNALAIEAYLFNDWIPHISVKAIFISVLTLFFLSSRYLKFTTTLFNGLFIFLFAIFLGASWTNIGCMITIEPIVFIADFGGIIFAIFFALRVSKIKKKKAPVLLY